MGLRFMAVLVSTVGTKVVVNRGTARVVLKLDLRCLGCQGWACEELVKLLLFQAS
jgi:hypothetical protein